LLGNYNDVHFKVSINGVEKEIKSIQRIPRPDVQKAINTAGLNCGFKISLNNLDAKGNVNIIALASAEGHKIKEVLNSNKVRL